MARTESVEVQVLRSFGREAHLRRKWNRLWTEIGDRILRLPQKEQNILLEDFCTAIKSRILVMERINDENRNR